MTSLTEYCSKGYKSVQGWLQPGSMSVLWSLLEVQMLHRLGGDVAEIGVFHGKLFIALALSLGQQERAVAVDIFEMPTVPDFEGAFRSNLARFAVPLERVTIRRCASDSISPSDARAVFGPNVRFFSIDGSHEYDAVLHDLKLARSVVSKVGIIALDDLFSAWSPGVTEAAIDFLRDPGNKEIVPLAISAADGPLITGASKLFLVHASQFDTYAKELMRLNGACFKTRARFCNGKPLVFDFARGVKKVVQFRDDTPPTPSSIPSTARPDAG
jgi:hypothetical protein